MKPVMGTTLKQEGVFVIHQIVVDVTKFMEYCPQLLTCGFNTLFYTYIFPAVHGPGAGVTYYLTIPWLQKHGPFPETPRQRLHAQRRIKILCHLDYLCGHLSFSMALRFNLVLVFSLELFFQLRLLLLQSRGYINIGNPRVRFCNVINFRPLLGPHVAKQVRGYAAAA